ncbi:MAG: hypothetical protein QNJ38_19375 [Prochloraceae cyanobacterium]|nr:hypothetical protein [Prochloraceae cyanobacterium]
MLTKLKLFGNPKQNISNVNLENPPSSSQDLKKTLEEVAKSSIFWAEILSEPSLLEDLKE